MNDAINLEYAPEIHEAPVSPLAEWAGDPLDSSATVMSIMLANKAFYEMLTPELRKQAQEFYSGMQWPSDIWAKRIGDGRPVLVINKIQTLVTNAIHASRQAGEYFSEEFKNDFICVVTLRNMDAQRMYNYMRSVQVEILSIRPTIICPAHEAWGLQA